jgi:DNA-binding NtrC family response regulator
MDTSTALHLAGILASLTIYVFVLKSALPDAPPSPPFRRICSASNTGPTVLAISQDRGCQERLANLAELYGWDLFLCSTCKYSVTLPNFAAIPIVLYDPDQLDMNWQDAFQLFLQSDRSRCLLLCSPTGDDRLWQEVIRVGGYDLVPKPICEEQIVRTIQFAWTFWKTVHRFPTAA